MATAGKSIAIIGGGVAGMSVAWHLHAQGFGVKVFEKNDRIGGKATTVDVVVGDEIRWVDLGVNDFNTRTFVNLATILDRLGVEYRPLEDTACYFTMDGTRAYTSDGMWGTAAPEIVRRDTARFHREAWEVLTSRQYRFALVKDYVAEKRYSYEFVELYLYPRINGMYFADRQGAGNLPIWPVMMYLSLQEGIDPHGTRVAERMYFVKGSGQ